MDKNYSIERNQILKGILLLFLEEFTIQNVFIYKEVERIQNSIKDQIKFDLND
jgi:hypothetical protein